MKLFGGNMSNNKEKKVFQDKIHMFLGLQRMSKQGKNSCIRHIIKLNEQEELEIFEAKLKSIGGEWRIHKTVNARDPEKARRWLIKRLIDHPEQASITDSLWRTALLQRECKTTNYFMLDIDTEDPDKINELESLIPDKICINQTRDNRQNGI